MLSLGIFLVTLQIFLGAWTSTNYAALSCFDFPLCNGQILPDSNFFGGFDFTQPIGANFLGGQLDHESRLAIHLSHRYGALIIFLYLSFLAAVIYKAGYFKISLLLIGLLFFQITLGISNVVFHLPLLVAVGHNIGGLFLITYLSVLRFRE
jgi:cytochrome c oxidase assembly protein subunit 15